MKQFDTLPIQYRRIAHIHEGVWLKKNDKNDSYENLDNYILILLLYMNGYCLLGPIDSYHSNLMEQFDTLRYNVDTLNICVKEFGLEKIIFVCTDSTETFFSKLRSLVSKLRSAGLNYKV